MKQQVKAGDLIFKIANPLLVVVSFSSGLRYEKSN